MNNSPNYVSNAELISKLLALTLQISDLILEEEKSPLKSISIFPYNFASIPSEIC